MVKKFIEYLEYLKNLKKNPPKIFGPEDATIFVIRTDSKGERNEENDLWLTTLKKHNPSLDDNSNFFWCRRLT